MDLYLTPDRYRTMGSGVDLSAKTDDELRSWLWAASVAVNQAVGAPQGYSFLGGHVIDEEHNWRVGDPLRGQRPSQRMWPFMRPLLTVEGMKIYVTRDNFISFTSEELFVQKMMGYVEPTTTPSVIALYTSVPPWLLSSPVAYLTYDYGFNDVVTDETPASLSGGILQGNHQFWFTDEDVVLMKNGVLVPGSAYTIDYVEGTVTPNTPPEPNDAYLLSYHTHLPAGIAMATALITTDLIGQSLIAGSGLLGLSGFTVEEVSVRQSAKLNFLLQPINAAAQIMLNPYAAMFVSIR